MTGASLRGGAYRKEMLPHCVQQPGAWPQPKEAGHGNNILGATHAKAQGLEQGARPGDTEGVQGCGDSCLGLDAMDRPVHLHIDSAEYADKTPNRVYRMFGIDNPSYKAK